MRRAWFAVCVLAVVTFFAGLGRAAIAESDEAFYAEAGREMVESGDWLTPHFNYEVRFQKPILYYWVVALSYRVAGVTEAAARFGSALSGLGLALLTFSTGRRLYGGATGLVAGAIVATSFGYFAVAHVSLPDLPLTFFITWAICEGLDAIDRPELTAPLLRAAAAAALGALTKGPLGVLIPGMILIAVAALERRLTIFTWRRLAIAAALFLVIAMPWYVAMTLVHGAEYLRGFFVGDNLERFATSRFNDPRAPYYYLPVIAGGLLPWTPFGALLVVPAWRWITRRRPLAVEERRLAAWVLLPLVFFTLSIGKQARYILPVLPPLAILIARAIDRRLGAGEGSAGVKAVRTAAIGSAGAIVLVGLTMWRVRGLLALSPNTFAVTLAAGIITLAGLAAAIVALAARPRGIVPALAGITAVTLAVLQYGVFSTPRAEPVELAAAVLADHRRANEPIATYHALSRNLVFYTHVHHGSLNAPDQVRAFLGSHERVFLVIDAHDAADFEREGFHLRRLAEFRYFDAGTMKARAIVSPNADRDLTAFVVATNGK